MPKILAPIATDWHSESQFRALYIPKGMSTVGSDVKDIANAVNRRSTRLAHKAAGTNA